MIVPPYGPPKVPRLFGMVKVRETSLTEEFFTCAELRNPIEKIVAGAQQAASSRNALAGLASI
jgi:hypothetical protein